MSMTLFVCVLVEVKVKIILPGAEGKEAGRKKTMELLPEKEDHGVARSLLEGLMGEEDDGAHKGSPWRGEFASSQVFAACPIPIDQRQRTIKMRD
jgi:hypothetical protein